MRAVYYSQRDGITSARMEVQSKMAVTISTHNGSQVRTAHNMRAKSCVEKEDHIDTSRPHEIWKHETVTQAYERLFGDAVAEYNARQQRPERRIRNYLAEVQKDAKKHDCYEIIVGVYGSECSDQLGKTILKAYVDSWKQRNPQLEMIGAYYHADEQGRAPHVHIDYIPVSSSYKKGLSVQTGLNRALSDMGYAKKGKMTPQIQWERAENAALEHYCTVAGLEVSHPQAGKGVQHQSTELYKVTQELQKAQKQLEVLKAEMADMTVKASQSRSNAFKLEEGIRTLEKEKNALQAKLEGLNEKYAIVGKITASMPLTPQQIREISPHKSFGGIKGITIEEIEMLKEMALETAKGKYVLRECEELRMENKQLKASQKRRLDENIRDADEKIKLKQKADAFDRLPVADQKRLLQQQNQDFPPRFHGREYER